MTLRTIPRVRKTLLRVFGLAVLFALGIVLTPRSVHAAPSFTVNSTVDAVASAPLDNGVCETAPGNGVCTLRAAIMKANHYPGGGVTINLPALPAGYTYRLAIPPSGVDDETTGDLNVTAFMNIVGAGATATTIDGNGSVVSDRVFTIANGVVVMMTGITIQNAKWQGLGEGAGIYNIGTLTLSNSVITGNTTTTNGAGIYSSGPLTIINSSIIGNGAANYGGVESLSSLTMSNSIVSGNQGGGVSVVGSAIIVNSTISGNLNAPSGGGIATASQLTLKNSTVSGNTTLGSGGGIYNQGTLNIVNSTISGNSAISNGGGINSVGANFGPATAVNASNATITNNQADSGLHGNGLGGGIYNGSYSTFTFQNTILAGNFETAFSGVGFAHYNPVIGECWGTISSTVANLMQSYNTGYCTVNGVLPSVADPKLGTLADNGGPTQTHALLAGSPAIDTGNPSGCTDQFGAPLTTDQRGANRPFGPRCDIGAYEYGAKIPQTIYQLYLPLLSR